ncbi:hypothetical protein GLAREA_02054 [Glarea lozoyensis ATCC 20868]|uniref:Uncharacterized protein n=1 Tax=Glarea lozoyensis (strain ATCC 20868 / MF5171) TaxID=1116229 RepID=S3CI35_GLAL2|nr:uncharacterized protein GLAREA_02054 [Glarea lozoyensis ATCC 20868]EPE26142.1 hypothetical protein GLAREA_02054 [Glarea lozoyensis ATCC 20868]
MAETQGNKVICVNEVVSEHQDLGGSQATPLPLAPYDRPAVYRNDYGDFAINRVPEEAMSEWTMMWGHPATLNFSKLPLEIRHRIYRLLLGPLWHEDYREKGKPYIPILLYEQEEPILADSATHLLAPPARSSLYDMRCYPQTGDDNDYPSEAEARDRGYLEWLRQVSNLSCVFRQEFAEVFWCRTRLAFYRTVNDLSILRGFIQDRPAISAGIKYLRLTIGASFGLGIPEGVRLDRRTLGSECKAISSLLSLETLHIHIHVDEEDLGSLSQAAGRFEALKGFQEFHTNQTFIVTLWIHLKRRKWRDPKLQGTFLDVEIYHASLAKIYEPKLRELLLPHSLRNKRLCDKDIYLNARALDAGTQARRNKGVNKIDLEQARKFWR